jgi:hypothetical protein
MSRAIGVSLFALLVATSAQAQQIGDVFYIALENHNFTQPSTVPAGTPQQLFGNTAAPYLNSLVTPGNANAAMTSYASNYQNVAEYSSVGAELRLPGRRGRRAAQRQRSVSEQHRQRPEPRSDHGGEGRNLAFLTGGRQPCPQ